jgi:hypothetical protein
MKTGENMKTRIGGFERDIKRVGSYETYFKLANFILLVRP